MSTPETLRWWAEQFRTRTSEFYTSHVLAADLNHAADEIESLERENARLRELIRDMNECLEHSKPYCKKCKFQELDCQWFKFITRMNELGIDVDG